MSEKDIPVKEQEDGSALFALEQEADPFAKEEEGEEPEEHAEGGKVEASDDEGDEGQDESEDEGEDEDEREKIREARREERKLKKELAKQREASAKHKISALERRNAMSWQDDWLQLSLRRHHSNLLRWTRRLKTKQHASNTLR